MLNRIISILFHPFLMPLYGVITLFTCGTWLSTINNQAKYYTILVTVTTTLVLPLACLYVLKLKKWISDYSLSDKKERRIPLMLQSFFAIVAAFILQKVSAPLILALYFNGISIFLLISAALSAKWNISTHMAGIGGLIGLILAVSLKWMIDLRLVLAILIVVASIVSGSRIASMKHTPAQVYTGLTLGFVIIFLLVYLV